MYTLPKIIEIGRIYWIWWDWEGWTLIGCTAQEIKGGEGNKPESAVPEARSDCQRSTLEIKAWRIQQSLLSSLPVQIDQLALSVAAIYSSFSKVVIKLCFMTRKSYSPHERAGQGYGGKERGGGWTNKRGERRENRQPSWVPFNVAEMVTDGLLCLLVFREEFCENSQWGD